MFTETEANGSAPSTPQRIGANNGPKMTSTNSGAQPANTTLKRSASKSHGTTNPPLSSKADVVPVIVPRTSARMEPSPDSRREVGLGRALPYNVQTKLTDPRKLSNANDADRPSMSVQSGFLGNKNTEPNEDLDSNSFSSANELNRQVASAERNVDEVRCFVPAKVGLGQTEASYHQENCMFPFQS